MSYDPIKIEAQRRHEAHETHPTHRPLSDDYELVGLRGEAALARAFGGNVDLTRRLGGDGGIDMTVYFAVPFKIDIKTARKPGNLIVEVGKVKPRTIYILAKYDDVTDSAEPLGWKWGASLLAAPVKDFGYGVINHFIPRAKLRPIAELLVRLVAAPFSEEAAA